MSTTADAGLIARDALRRAAQLYEDDPQTVAMLEQRLDRLTEPLRVAIVGKVKAGKSTLLNALIGEEIAPTDAGECTRVVTYYQYGRTPAITLHPRVGSPQNLTFSRVDGRLAINLGPHDADEIDKLVVHWPSQNLRQVTLIDTPGIDSISTEIAERTLRAFDSEDEPAAADAVIYLMRHLHASDLDFLESFRQQSPAGIAMINTMAVLSRADEIGAGRIDAMISAKKVADRYALDDHLRDLCQTVVPVAGLLAVAARTLRHTEFVALNRLAQADHHDVRELMLSSDRFRRPGVLVGLSRETRIDLLDRLGMFGIRMALAMIRSGITDATALANELARRSGLDELRHILFMLFTERGEQLKIRSALLSISALLRDRPRPDTDDLAYSIEQVMAGAHQFRELRLLAELRSGVIPVPDDALEEAMRLLGGNGARTTDRLNLPVNALVKDQLQAAQSALSTWVAHAANPLNDSATTAACDAICRSCEGMLDELDELDALRKPGGA